MFLTFNKIGLFYWHVLAIHLSLESYRVTNKGQPTPNQQYNKPAVTPAVDLV